MKQIILSCCLFIATLCHAQTIKVERMQKADTDGSAVENPRLDLNGNPCALVKVALSVPNASFGGNVIGNVYRNGADYWVYMTNGSKRLQIKHPDYKTAVVDFSDFNIQSLSEHQTYLMNVLLPSTTWQSATTGFNAITYEQGHDYVTDFFPVNGITLGKTTYRDALDMGLKCTGTANYEIKTNTIKFDNGVFTTGTVYPDNEYYDQFQILEFPAPWVIKYGMHSYLSYNQWLALFKALSYRVDIFKEPVITSPDYVDFDVMTATIKATSPDGSLQFSIDISSRLYPDINPLDAPNGFGSTIATVRYLKNKKNEDAIAATKGVSAEVKIKDSVKTFFPIKGISLGESTWNDIYEAGFAVDPTSYDVGCVANADGIFLGDPGKKGYFTEILICRDQTPMPIEWQRMGMSWGNSQDLWIRLFEERGYNISVLEEPRDIEKYYKGDILAESPDGGLSVQLRFLGELGSTTSTPGTLYQIEMAINE